MYAKQAVEIFLTAVTIRCRTRLSNYHNQREIPFSEKPSGKEKSVREKRRLQKAEEKRLEMSHFRHSQR